MQENSSDYVLDGLEDCLIGEKRGILSDLQLFVDLLKKWQTIQNLVSRETLADLWMRHIRDSLQLLRYFPVQQGVVVDLGSGGGFPAIPLAIALRKSDWKFHLIEANRRKCSFLRTVSRELALNVTVHDSRIEKLDRQLIGNADIITSRATAPLVRLLGLCAPFWSEKTSALLHKGREYGEELKEAGAVWQFDVLCLASETDPAGVIVKIDQLSAKLS
ncbi:16S rRNA (guanine(527)-N(7))-methyltransferase [hydrothermal vent metagenome]|uniref:16S rRNA (Guanine(527)-N(7))-methyltransferase n=1 Tax=hydrothermal vent metagenome TaxID=652676 RepID=A0A3B0TV69_9ZZZZ